MPVLLLLVAAGLAFGLVGCTKRTPEEALQRRAQEFWDAKVRKDWVKAYDYLDPVDRDRVSLNAWLTGFGAVEWPEATVKGAEVTGSRGLAEVHYKYVVLKTFARGQTGEDTVKEQWILRDGRWYKQYVSQSLTAPGDLPK